MYKIIFILAFSLVSFGAEEDHIRIINGAGPVKVLRTTLYDVDVSRGHFPDTFLVPKFGHNPDVDTGTVPEDIWHLGGEYTGFPTGSAELIEVVSSSADDAEAGVGCRTVMVFGLDANYDLQSETVVMAGLTAVDTVNTYLRSYRSMCLTAGSSETNVGLITIRHTTTTANVFGAIETGVGGTQNSMFTVPNNYRCIVRHYEVSLSDNTQNRASIAIWVRPPNGATRLVNHFNISTAFHSNYYPPGGSPLGEKTDLKMRVTGILNNNGHLNFTGTILCFFEEEQ